MAAKLFTMWALARKNLACSETQTRLYVFLNDGTFGPPSNLHTCFSRLEFYRVGMDSAWSGDPSHLLSCSKLCFIGIWKVPGVALCQISTPVSSRAESYRIGVCVGCRFSPMKFFPFLVRFSAFSDAPHTRFRSRNPKLFLMGFWRIQLLALRQIFTCVFHMWNSFELDSTWVWDNRPCHFSFIWCISPRLAMCHKSKIISSDSSRISTRETHAWTFLKLDSVWIGASPQCHFSFLARLVMYHSRGLGIEILNYALWVLKDASFGPESISTRVFSAWFGIALNIAWVPAHVIFLTFCASSRVEQCIAFSV